MNYYIYKFNFLKLITCLALLIGLQSIGSATHIAGGNITYRCLGNDLYEVTLEVRRDCINGAANAPFDNPASVGIFNGVGQLTTLGNSGQILMNLNTQDTLVEVLTSECRVLGSEVCVERTVYTRTIELPYEPTGYILAYQRCCRSIDLLNVLDPTNTGTTEWINISPQAQEECNSSPTFNQWPTVYACSNQELIFDHSATDIDGDSLVYKLCTPYQGATDADPIPQPPARPPYDLITWNTGYSTDNPLGSSVPLTIDPNTGILTGMPELTGQYLVGVCVEEYRDGILLSTVRRNFEYNIRVCINNPVADFNLPENPNCESLTQTFENTSTPGAYTWYFDYPINSVSSTETDPTYTFPEPGLYPVQLIVVDNDCIDSTVINVGVSLPDDPIAAYSYSSVDCSDDVTLDFINQTTTIQEQTGYNWLFEWDGGMFSSTDENPSVTVPGDVDLTITFEVTTISGCTDVFTETIFVESSFLELIADAIEICQFNSLEPILNASDNLTYTWSPTNNLDLSDPNNPIITAVNDITYSVTATDGVCTIVDEIEITVSEEQDVIINGDAFVCDESSTLNIVSPSGATVAWYSDEQLTNEIGTGMTITVNPPQGESTYYASLVGDICQGVGSFTVTNEPLDFTLSGGDDLVGCSNELVELVVTNNDNDHDLEVQWDTQYLLAGQGNETGSFSFPSAGTYLVNLTVSNQFMCSIDTSLEVTVYDIVGIDFDRIDACYGDDVFLNPIAPNQNWNYLWVADDPSLVFDATSPNPLIENVTESIVFTLTVADNDLGFCQSTFEILLNVPQKINLDGPIDINYCPGIDTDFAYTAEVGVEIYIINENNDSTLLVGGILNANLFEDGNYTIAAVDENGCFENIMISIDDFADINMVIPDEVVYCPGDTPILDVITDVDVSITLFNSTGEPVFTGNPITVSDFPDGEYTVVATDENGCMESENITFTTYDAINLDAPSEVLYCPGEEVSIMINSDIEIEVKILDMDGNIVAEGTEIVISELPPGEYNIMATSNDGCGEMQSLIILSPAEINLELSTSTPKYCSGDDVTLIASSDTSVDIEWFDQDGNSVGTGFSIVVQPAGMLTYTAVATDASGCADQAEITIMEYILDVTIDAPNLICENDEGMISITNNDPDQMLTYSWAPQEAIVSGANSDQLTVFLSGDTTFEVLITNMDGCTWTESVTILSSGFEPDVIATADPMDVLLGQTTQLGTNQNNDTYEYEWDNSSTLDDAFIENPIASPEESPTTYTVTVTNADGCTAESSVTIGVTLPNCDESDVFIPNLFSPNGDDFNDFWKVESNFVDEIEILVYNRWGQEVFKSDQQLPGWDGTFDGSLLEPDVYGYWIRVVCINGFEYTTKGNVTLMR